jgi:glycosyltransferase involved in cell wall biosynthesis
MKKIAFVWYGRESTIIEQDYKLLEKHFDVEAVRFSGIKSGFTILNAVKRNDIVFSWFADVWSFVAVVAAKVFKKKSVVVVGGYDVECIKEIGYGMCMKPWWRKWMRTYALKHATIVLSVSEYTSIKAHYFIWTEVEKNIVVYNGVDTNYFKPGGAKENIVLTVASGGDNDIIALKGLDKFVALAKHVPRALFVVAGLNQTDRHALSKLYSTNNVKLVGRCTQQELLQWYQRAKVYCQLSKVESFGMSLAEAMACGCIPVGGLPEVDGGCGRHVFYDSKIEEVVDSVKWALKIEEHLGESTDVVMMGRNHIKQNFSIEQREQKLVQILECI